MNIIECLKSKRTLAVLAAFVAVSICWATDNPTEITSTTTTYTRTKGSGSWGTLCVPKQIESVTGATLWIPYYWNEESSSFYIRKVETSEFPLPAGTPVMFQYDGTAGLSVTMSGDMMTLTDEQKTNGVYSSITYMTGNPGNLISESITVGEGCYVLIYNNKSNKEEIRHVTKGNVSIPKYRAYLDFSNLPTSKPSTTQAVHIKACSLDGGIDDGETGLDEIVDCQREDAISYDLLGRKVSGLAHGIIITNGKKVIKH